MRKFFLITLLTLSIFSVGFWVLSPHTKLALFSSVEKLWARVRPSKPNSFINHALLKQKIAQGLPDWAREQIAADLSKFPSIAIGELDGYFKIHASVRNKLVRFKISQGTLSTIVQDQSLLALKSYKIIHNMLEFLAKNRYVPDTDFILSLQDYVILENAALAPILTFAKDTRISPEKDLILVPDWMNLRSRAELKPRIQYANFLFPWDKKQPLLFWRGSLADSTGFRKTLVSLTEIYPELIDARFSQNDPMQYVSEEKHIPYRYQITIDGARGTWERLVWQLQSNCLVLKHSSHHIQWFYRGIIPKVHYIPIEDSTALLKTLAWAESSPKDANKIISQARDFADNNLNLEDLYHYWIGVLQAYSQKLH